MAKNVNESKNLAFPAMESGKSSQMVA